MVPPEQNTLVARPAGYGPPTSIVVQSWQRSRSAGIDPEAVPHFRCIPAQELQQRQRADGLLLELAIPHLRWLSRWFAQRPHVAYVVDADGIVLHAEGAPELIERYHLSPGHDWSEAAMGTNGAGTALMSGAPVAVVGCDHWSTTWRNATCLGAPILGSEGRPVGAIDISMDVQDGDAERLVVAAHVAYTISQELARYTAEARRRATEQRYAGIVEALAAEQRAHADSEAALARAAEAEGALQAIIDAMPAVVYVVDADARFRFINRRFADVFGMDPAAVVGQPLSECFPPALADEFAANNARVLSAGRASEFEEVVPVGDERRTYLSVKAPLCGADGAPYAVCGVSTDITEQMRLISALQVAQRQKDAVIATVAHELRQPLGAIQAGLAVMQSRSSRERGERARAVVARQAQQLARMVEDLLDAARVTQGKVALQLTRAAIADIIDAATVVVLPDLHERQQHLHLDVPPETIWLNADVARLQQVFSNLLTNAVKFTDPGGDIFVTIGAAADSITVRVRDTGRGVPSHMLPHIFDLFSQASSDGSGLGIGLSVVRALVERHHGTVSAHSDGPGHGTEFIVRLPRVCAEPSEAVE